METITTAEIVELAILSLSQVDAQFQYWISASFAVIVASYLVGDDATRIIRWAISALYLCVSVVFFSRYFVQGTNAITLIGEATARGFPWASQPLGAYFLFLRPAVILAGTTVTIWFALVGYRLRQTSMAKRA